MYLPIMLHGGEARWLPASGRARPPAQAHAKGQQAPQTGLCAPRRRDGKVGPIALSQDNQPRRLGLPSMRPSSINAIVASAAACAAALSLALSPWQSINSAIGPAGMSGSRFALSPSEGRQIVSSLPSQSDDAILSVRKIGRAHV